jgi:MFS transporter, PPP family, 3-phenylpropionic acid transporter
LLPHREQSRGVNALRLYYFAAYTGLGAVMPLLSLSMQARGFRPSQYAWLMALIPASRLVAPPLWGALADRWLGTVRLLRINTALAAVAMLVLAYADDLALTVAAFSLWAITSSSLTPLADAGAYRLLGAASGSFARVRVFGSIGFALSALALGTFGIDAALRAPFAIAACTYVCSSVTAGYLFEGTAPTRAPLAGAVRTLAGRADTWLLWLGSVFYYLGHGAFDAYFGPFAGTLPGVRAETVSFGWALGVTAEVALLWWVPRLLGSRLRRGLLIGAAGVAVVRWWLIAEATTPLTLWLQQPLHAITFGLWYVVFVHENQAGADASIRATVQGVAAACMGLGMITATLLGGYVFEALGGRSLFRMASVAALLALLCYAARQWLRARHRASSGDNALASAARQP